MDIDVVFETLERGRRTRDELSIGGNKSGSPAEWSTKRGATAVRTTGAGMKFEYTV